MNGVLWGGEQGGKEVGPGAAHVEGEVADQPLGRVEIDGGRAGHLGDKYGRKPIWSLYVIITIISLFLLTSTDSIPMLLFIGSFVAFFGTGIMPVCKVYIAEQYPTELRGVGTGFGEAVSRVVGGVLATYYLAFFLSVGGVKGVFTFMAVAFAIAIIALWIWGQETARRSVEDTSAAPQK